MRALGYHVVDLLADHFSHLGENAWEPKGDPALLGPLLRQPPPTESVPEDEIFATLIYDVFTNMMNVGHPRPVPVPSNFVSGGYGVGASTRCMAVA